MLNIITGPAGSGKTAEAVRRAVVAAEDGNKTIFLVPDQFSFETERELFRTHGARTASEIDVVGFKRLCQNIFRECGGTAGRYVTDAGRVLLMSRALEQCSDMLELYAKRKNDVSLISAMISAVNEFKACAVGPDELREISAGADGAFAEKTREFSLIYETYQALLERGFLDSEDDLRRAAKKAAQYFAGKRMVVDGFAAFSAAEFELLKTALVVCDDFVVTLPGDRVTGEYDALAVPAGFKARFVRAAKENFVPVGAVQVLEGNRRAQNPAIKALSERFMRDTSDDYPDPEDPGDAVVVFAADDMYAEIERAAVKIKQLVTEQNYKYSDIVLIARKSENYRLPIERIFPRYDIPYFMSRPRSVLGSPFVTGLRAALRATEKNYDTAGILAFSKSLCFSLTPSEAGELENYVFMWSPAGDAWTQNFTHNPYGLAGRPDEKAAQKLREINRLRQKTMAPLIKLKESLKHADGEGFARAVYDFLCDIGAAENLTANLAELSGDSAAAELERERRAYGAIVETLDDFKNLAPAGELGTARFAELFELALSAAEVGSVPETLDRVLVGSADSVRPLGPKAVFIVGAAEGEFPAEFGGNGLFSSAERSRLAQSGAELFSDRESALRLERYYAYSAVTAGRDYLSVSCPVQSLTGEKKIPSVVVRELEKIYGKKAVRVRGLLPEEKIFSVKHAADAVRSPIPATCGEASAARYLKLSMNEHRLRYIGYTPPARFKIASREKCDALFGKAMRLSPSKIERFYRCPFSYFCSAGLKIRPRGRVEFNPMESGNITHKVLEIMLANHTGAELSTMGASRIKKEISEIIDNFLRENQIAASSLPKRFTYLYTRLVNSLTELILRLAAEFAQSDFRPVGFELPIGGEGEYAELELYTADGKKVSVEGTVDRADIMEKDGKKYLRVVDYKSGVKRFSLAEVFEGLGMQMLIYLFALAQSGKGKFESAVPAGVLYMPAGSKFVTVWREAPPEHVVKEKLKNYKMSGLVLGETDIIKGMEQEAKGVFIPAGLKKDGQLSAGSAAVDFKELMKIKDITEQNIKKMAELLGEGHVAAGPTSSGGFNPCEYCDYRPVCGAGPENRPRVIKNRPLKDLLREADPAEQTE